MNLRKDHCRNLPSRTTRELVSKRGPRGPAAPRPLYLGGVALGSRGRPFRAYKRTPARIAPRKLNERARPRRPRKRCARAASSSSNMSKRLSATDISALASMKNVAKCDTWCELQNPANHRVFERKLRPKPSGRGHVCLGVTHRCPQPHRLSKRRGRSAGRTLASRELSLAAGLKASPRRRAPRQSVVDKPSCPVVRGSSLVLCSVTL